MLFYKALQVGTGDSVSGANPIEVIKSVVDIPAGVIAGDSYSLVSCATFVMNNLATGINAYAAIFEGPVLFRGGAAIDFDFTPGSVIFAGPSGVLAQNNSQFYWDNTNYRLGIRTATPTCVIDMYGGRFRATSDGTNPTGPTTGIGLQIMYLGTSDRGYVGAYDAATPGYKTLQIEGLQVWINSASGGNTGFGTAVPTAKVHIMGDINVQSKMLISYVSATNSLDFAYVG